MSDSSNNAQSSFNPGASAKSRRIVFTGGGSAGHVTLNLALIPRFLEQGWQVSYIGSKGGMEQELVSRFSEVRYYGILTGKLRRYFSWQNFLDMGKSLPRRKLPAAAKAQCAGFSANRVRIPGGADGALPFHGRQKAGKKL